MAKKAVVSTRLVRNCYWFIWYWYRSKLVDTDTEGLMKLLGMIIWWIEVWFSHTGINLNTVEAGTLYKKSQKLFIWSLCFVQIKVEPVWWWFLAHLLCFILFCCVFCLFVCFYSLIVISGVNRNRIIHLDKTSGLVARWTKSTEEKYRWQGYDHQRLPGSKITPGWTEVVTQTLSPIKTNLFGSWGSSSQMLCSLLKAQRQYKDY